MPTKEERRLQWEKLEAEKSNRKQVRREQWQKLQQEEAEEPKTLTEPPTQTPKEPFDHDFSWGKMAKNIVPSMIQNIEDLKHLPGAVKAIPQLANELLSIGRLDNREGKFPLLNGIKDFYKQNYNLATSEGQQTKHLSLIHI